MLSQQSEVNVPRRTETGPEGGPSPASTRRDGGVYRPSSTLVSEQRTAILAGCGAGRMQPQVDHGLLATLHLTPTRDDGAQPRWLTRCLPSRDAGR